MIQQQTILNVLLSTWLFVSSSGLLLNMHFCSDLLRSAGLDNQQEQCAMHMPVENENTHACCAKKEVPKTCHSVASEPNANADTCCTDSQLSFDIDIECSSISSNKFFNQELNVTRVLFNELASSSRISTQKNELLLLSQQKSPPVLVQPHQNRFSLDIPLQKQSFLN